MSDFKYLMWAHPLHPNYDPILDKPWFRLWNHWLNPIGNWHEPLPFPEKRLAEAKESRLPNWVYWNIRNFGHNFTHFWIGIVPIGQRYEWIAPQENGWVQDKVSEHTILWKRPGSIPRPYYHKKFLLMGEQWSLAIGWKSDGCLGLNLRRESRL